MRVRVLSTLSLSLAFSPIKRDLRFRRRTGNAVMGSRETLCDGGGSVARQRLQDALLPPLVSGHLSRPTRPGTGLTEGERRRCAFEDLMPRRLDERARSLRNCALGPRVRPYIFFYDRFLIISGSRCERAALVRRRESIARGLQGVLRKACNNSRKLRALECFQT